MIGRIKKRDEPVAVDLSNGRVAITLRDDRIVSMPISFFTWLDKATPEQQANFEIYTNSIFWPDLEDGIDMYAFITGTWAKKRNVSEVG